MYFYYNFVQVVTWIRKKKRYTHDKESNDKFIMEIEPWKMQY